MPRQATRPSALVLYLILTPLALVASQDIDSLPSPLICRDTLDGSPPFRHNDIPCLLGCGTPITVPTGGLLPGSINSTAIPYCQLDCVHSEATPQQSSRAPDCNAGCKTSNGATPENLGWCMYWCVNGYSDIVHSTTCVPSLVYGDPTPTAIAPDVTITLRPFTQPPEYVEWFETQTILGSQPTQAGPPQTSVLDDGEQDDATTPSSLGTTAPEAGTPPTTAVITPSTTDSADATTTAATSRGPPQTQEGSDSDPDPADEDENENQAALAAGASEWPALLMGVAVVAGMLIF